MHSAGDAINVVTNSAVGADVGVRTTNKWENVSRGLVSGVKRWWFAWLMQMVDQDVGDFSEANSQVRDQGPLGHCTAAWLRHASLTCDCYRTKVDETIVQRLTFA